MNRPRVLTIAGIDPCGGAGLGADARTIHVCGGDAATVPTCTTVQNRHGFERARAVPADDLRAMLDAVVRDAPVGVAKVGLCADAATVDAIAAWHAALGDTAPRLVVDPVLSATAGGGPAERGALAAAIAERLAPRAFVVTPNAPELDALGGVAALLACGAHAVLVTGGHGEGDIVVDRAVTARGEHAVRHPRIVRGPVHGTGCALSAALATFLARGDGLEEAFVVAVDRVQRWLRATPDDGSGLPEPLAVG